VLGKVLFTHLGAEDRFIFSDPMHDAGKPARVVHLRMIADHVVNFFGINNRGDVVEQLIGKLPFDRIDECHFLIQDQKCVVSRPFMG